MSQLASISQNTDRGGSTTTTTTQTVTHGKVTTTSEGERVSTDAVGAASGSKGSAVAAFDDAGFSISFSIPIRGGLNAGGGAPQDL